MKKILHIQLYCKMSGVQKISYEILKNIGEEYEKTILFSEEKCIGNMQETLSAFSDMGINVVFSKAMKHRINIIYDLKAIWEIYRFCKQNEFDIVHTNSSKPGIVGRIGATLAGTPMVVHTVHGTSFTPGMAWYKWVFYYLCEYIASFFCDKIILVNQYYKKYYWYSKNKVKTIYNAIDYDELKKGVRTQDYSVKLLYVGRLDKQKNPLFMLKAFELARKKEPKLELTIVGDGELMDACKLYVKKVGLSEAVRFVGWTNNPSDYYTKSDIFISTPRYEAFGLTFLEAGFYSLPVISVEIEGIPEVVIDGKTGLLGKVNDAKDIAKKILILSGDLNLRKKMGDEAHEYVLNHFSLIDMVDEYKKIYQGSC